MRFLLVLSVVIGLAVISLPSCAPVPEAEPEPQVDVNADKEAINKAGEQLRDALDNDDVDGIMACLTHDHITMAPDVPALDDLENLRKWHEARIEEVSIQISPPTHEIEVLGDWAVDRWRNTLTSTPRAGGDSVQLQNKGMWIWKRQGDGDWKLAYSIWNSDAP